MSIIFLLLLLTSSCTSPVLCDKDDGSMLLKIKEQLGNPRQLKSWVKGTNYCHYSGVLCISTGRVSYLGINEFGTSFSAPFPKAICDLTGLMALQIIRVQLYGPIPFCINKLSNLISLYTAETTLSGPLPGFPYHKNLTAINIFKNLMSGSIPSSLSTLPNLLYLDLSSNYLTGTIPPGLVHNSSSRLYLSNNSLTGEIQKYYGWWISGYLMWGITDSVRGDASFLFGKQKQAYGIFLNSNEFEFDLSYVQIPQNLSLLDLSAFD